MFTFKVQLSNIRHIQEKASDLSSQMMSTCHEDALSSAFLFLCRLEPCLQVLNAFDKSLAEIA